MCVLAIISAGASIPRSTLEAMFSANPDGAGWAYAKNGKIFYSKGYTNANKFIKAVQRLPDDVARMVHCRIATHGGVCKPLTHPFPVAVNYADMERLAGVMSSGYILAHNGILHNFNPPSKHSDTEELARCLANLNCDIMGANMSDLINALVDGSRVAILNTSGEINRYGTGWLYDAGVWYSNTYFKARARYYSAYDYDDWSDYDGYYSTRRPSTTSTTGTATATATPSLADLVPLEAGEIVKITDKASAYINAYDGAFLLDDRTGKLYGQYQGALFTTTREICTSFRCETCGYKCPIKERG